MYTDIIAKQLDNLGLPAEINPEEFENLLDMYSHIINKFAERPAFTSLGKTITYRDLDDLSNAFAAYIQHKTDLQEGDRIAIQLPNVIQYPVAVLGALKAGLIVVNTNPLYTERELEHQFNDAGAKALVVLANVAETASKVVPDTGVKTVIVTELADLHPVPKRQILNFLIKHVKKMVPDFNIPGAIRFTDVIKEGSSLGVTPAKPKSDDIAVLQYTGGTTGVAKGAMLTHRNLISNTLQTAIIFGTYGFSKDSNNLVQPLPLYHIYAVIVSYIVMMNGGHTILIPNPRDLPGLVKELGKWEVHGFCGLNTLFVALINNEGFRSLDFSHLKMTLSGGMALTRFAAEEWQKITGCEIYEGYGLTETSPVVSVNSGNGNRIGTIGVPLPSTDVDVRDDDGNSLPVGEAGELCVKGPQVMKGYWQRDDETAKTVKDGWLLTGDVAVISEDAYITIVDRKKDMILVSGFNVYPNEVENVVVSHDGILEAAAIGHEDDKSGEIVHVYAVKAKADVTEEQVIEHCREQLAAYKVPKRVFFKDELPKTNVGKILRRQVKADAQGE